MGQNLYNRAGNAQTRAVAKKIYSTKGPLKNKSNAANRLALKHPKSYWGVVGAGAGQYVGHNLGGGRGAAVGAAVGGAAGAGMGAMSAKYGRTGRIRAVHGGMENPQLTRHGFVPYSHPNQRNAKTAIRSSSPSHTGFGNRVGSK